MVYFSKTTDYFSLTTGFFDRFFQFWLSPENHWFIFFNQWLKFFYEILAKSQKSLVIIFLTSGLFFLTTDFFSKPLVKTSGYFDRFLHMDAPNRL